MQPTPKRKYFQILKMSNYLLGIGGIMFLMIMVSCNSSNQGNKTSPASSEDQDLTTCVIRFKYLRMKADTFCKYFQYNQGATFKKFVFQVGISDLTQNKKDMGLYCFAVGRDDPADPGNHRVLGSFWLEDDTTTPKKFSSTMQIYPDLELDSAKAANFDCLKCDSINNYLLFTPKQKPNNQIYYQISIVVTTPCKSLLTSVPANPSPPAKPGSTGP